MDTITKELSHLTAVLFKETEGLPRTPAGIAKARDALRSFSAHAQKIINRIDTEPTMRQVILEDMSEKMEKQNIMLAMDFGATGFSTPGYLDDSGRVVIPGDLYKSPGISVGGTVKGGDINGRILSVEPVWDKNGHKFLLCTLLEPQGSE